VSGRQIRIPKSEFVSEFGCDQAFFDVPISAFGIIPRVISVSFVKQTTVDLEHGVVDFDYVRQEPVVIMFIHALNPERDLHRGCTDHG
jgi:hypothetical protein